MNKEITLVVMKKGRNKQTKTERLKETNKQAKKK